MRLSSSVVALAWVLLSSSISGWGQDGHVYVSQVAAQKIPLSMPFFLRQAEARLAYLSFEPDRWREASEYALKASQEPDHFINLEPLATFGDLPGTRYSLYKRLFAHRATAQTDRDQWLPESVGLQPYITIEVYDRLKVAFREYRRLSGLGKPTEAVEQNAVFYAGWLAHYVADGAQPLHTTIHHNGWVGSNPHEYATASGIHARFETHYVGRAIVASDFAPLVQAPARLADPFDDYLAFLRASHAQVERVYQLDKAGGFNGAGTQDALEFTRQRLAAGSQMLLNLWWTAWVESGTT